MVRSVTNGHERQCFAFQMLNLGDRVTKSYPPRHQRTHDVNIYLPYAVQTLKHVFDWWSWGITMSN